MRITIVLGAFFPVPPIMGGAVEKAWFILAQEFARAGHEVVQISRAHPQLPARETLAGVRHLRVSGFAQPRSGLWLKALDLAYSLRVLPMLPPADIIVTNTFWLPIFLRTAARGKVYVHVARFPKGQLRFYRHAARLQAPSSSVADAAIAEVPSMRLQVRVVPYPRPAVHTMELPTFTERARTILYVGRVHPEKGLHLLVRAFASLPPAVRASWKLRVVGPVEPGLGGGGAEYADALRRLAPSEDVQFVGPEFDGAKLEQELRAAALFVYPSLAETGETFGLAPLEAMTHGCPVLVSDLACFRDFVKAEQTGFVFDHRAGDPAEALRNKLAQLLADEALLTRVAQTGFEQSHAYAAPAVARQFLDDFETLLEEAHVSPGSR